MNSARPRGVISLKGMDTPFALVAEPSPYDSPQTTESAPRGVLWVLQAAGATLAISAWGVLLLHVVLVVRAEHRLAAVLESAEHFSQLPGVTERELVDYTHRQLGRQRFDGGTLKLGAAPHARVTVEGVKAQPAGWLSRVTSTASSWLAGESAVEVGASDTPSQGFFAK
ncbi:hypothetical protein [Aeoliella sp. SH292]|uniref:hypothetical protein n=1 Tax=Aeoliella sp. SH292 TaxID=3454464 RepID=UPI003F994726